MAAVHQGPLQALNGGGDNRYFKGSYRRGIGSGNAKRKSAVELLEETKPLYVKSCGKRESWIKGEKKDQGCYFPSHASGISKAISPPPDSLRTRVVHYQCCHSQHRFSLSQSNHQGSQSSKSPKSTSSPFSFPESIHFGRENCEKKNSHHGGNGQNHKSPQELQNQLRRLLNADSKENLSNDQDWNVGSNGEDQVGGGFRRSGSRESTGSSLANNGRLISPPPGFNDEDESGSWRGFLGGVSRGFRLSSPFGLAPSKSLPDLAPEGGEEDEGGGNPDSEDEGNRGKSISPSRCISDGVYVLRRRRWSDEDRNTLKAFSNREESDDYDSYNSSERSNNGRDFVDLIKSTSFSCKGSEKTETREYRRRGSLGDLKLFNGEGRGGEGKKKNKRKYKEIPYSLIGVEREEDPGKVFFFQTSDRTGLNKARCKSETLFPLDNRDDERRRGGGVEEREGISQKSGRPSGRIKSPRLLWPPLTDALDSLFSLPLPQELNEFFQYLGLTSSEYESLTCVEERRRERERKDDGGGGVSSFWSDSSSASHVSSQGSSATGSTGGSSPLKKGRQFPILQSFQVSGDHSHQRSKSLSFPSKRKGGGGGQLPSLVESNARVIKWLCACSKNKII